MNLRETAEIVATLLLQYPNVTPSEPLIRLWHRALGHYPMELVTSASIHVLNTHTGFHPPTIAHVVQAIRKLSPDCETEMSDGEAWQVLTKAISRFGRYNQIHALSALERESRIVAQAVSMMGWETICNWKVDDEVANRAHFWRVVAGLRSSMNHAAVKREENPTLLSFSQREISRGN